MSNKDVDDISSTTKHLVSLETCDLQCLIQDDIFAKLFENNLKSNSGILTPNESLGYKKPVLPFFLSTHPCLSQDTLQVRVEEIGKRC